MPIEWEGIAMLKRVVAGVAVVVMLAGSAVTRVPALRAVSRIDAT